MSFRPRRYFSRLVWRTELPLWTERARGNPTALPTVLRTLPKSAAIRSGNTGHLAAGGSPPSLQHGLYCPTLFASSGANLCVAGLDTRKDGSQPHLKAAQIFLRAPTPLG